MYTTGGDRAYEFQGDLKTFSNKKKEAGGGD